MIIQLKNFGPIEHFEFDTEKQMHFIFGENNIGKSYAISAVYLILKNLNYHGWTNPKIELQANVFDKFVKDINHKMTSRKNAEEIDITNESETMILNIFEMTYLPLIYQSFSNTFNSLDNLRNGFSDNRTEIVLNYKTGAIFSIYIDDNNLILNNVKLDFNVTIKDVNTDRYPFYGEYAKGKKNFKLFNNIKTNKINYLERIPNMLISQAIETDNQNPNKIYFLPASRSGLYNALNAFGAIFAELSRNRNFISSKFSLPNMPEQLSDYFLNLSSIKKQKKEDIFFEIAKKIEVKILKGEVIFDDNDKKIYYQPNRVNIRLDLSGTSSMISEIAPIVTYLKYVVSEFHQSIDGSYSVKEKSMIFIEEPEAHLHPKIQVELIKLFAELAKKGLKIVMTSHSNYLFNKLSNMILAKEIDPNNITVAHMKMGEKGSYIDKDSMKMDTEGIEDDNFSDVAEELYMERLKLYEQTH